MASRGQAEGGHKRHSVPEGAGHQSGGKKVRQEEAAPQEYEVERIVDHTVVDGKVHFLVKWKGWDHKDNTWEPEEHLQGCEGRLFWYFRSLRGAKSLLRLDADSDQVFEKFKHEFIKPTRDDLDVLLKEFWGKNGGLKLEVPSENETKKNFVALLRIPQEMRPRILVDLVRRQLLLRELAAMRVQQRELLDQWEYEMNTITKNEAPIKVENNVDLEGPPEEFTYITDYLPGEGISIPEDPPIGCSCLKCERRTRTCCGHLSNSVFAYTQDRRLMVPLGTPIYECNKRCKCKGSCPNRVVQNGRKTKLAIFRTRNGCGWGVKALQSIKTGTFVCEYVGEVISNEEAERRGKVYDVEGRTYLFDLDYNDTEQVPYTVDAAVYGNVSHFINHSCNPNLAVFAVWINCLDPNLPKLALFSTRHIKEGDEITFDYSRPKMDVTSVLQPEISKEQPAPEVAYSPYRSPSRPRVMMPTLDNEGALPEGTQTSNYRMQCRCNANNCRKYLF
ncbi:histone-lysine N-methyltransferase SUV39H2 [Bacillus rossius redtenbacheri]|uniref:histone-lysine N-methyltransferase SUV39H2 n=1 Tax=Bacillus rossius redtenbacheri TaxID=93214 RepID=UPI002FDD9ABB